MYTIREFLEFNIFQWSKRETKLMLKYDNAKKEGVNKWFWSSYMLKTKQSWQ